MISAIPIFQNHREAIFVRRPNRFLIVARDGDDELDCHCPNPGRLAELLVPGARLILERRDQKVKVPKAAKTVGSAENPVSIKNPKTAWTVVAVFYWGSVVPLFSARANDIARELLLAYIIPNLHDIRAEFAVGGSRFDFLATEANGQKHLVEVKACSLVQGETALFPDAPSERATRHLEELAVLSRQGYRCHVLFVVVHGSPSRFMPNPHTDPLFAATLARLALQLEVHAALVSCAADGMVSLVNPGIPVDLSPGILAAENRGSYLVVLELPQAFTITVGSLGAIDFKAGWYVYAGSAQKNLSQRLARHLRKIRKKTHWHLDWLTPHAGKLIALPIASWTNLECALATSQCELGGKAVDRFGSSDCGCGSHLYYYPHPPLADQAFMKMLFRFRLFALTASGIPHTTR